jgi:hypothetical protein
VCYFNVDRIIEEKSQPKEMDHRVVITMVLLCLIARHFQNEVEVFRDGGTESCRTSGSHGGEYEDGCLQGCSAV